LLTEKGVAFAPVTGKQCERVEELFGEDARDFWILGDSATRIKHNGRYVYESLIPNYLGLEIIRLLEEIDTEQTIIACTEKGAYVKNDIPMKNMRSSEAHTPMFIKYPVFVRFARIL